MVAGKANLTIAQLCWRNKPQLDEGTKLYSLPRNRTSLRHTIAETFAEGFSPQKVDAMVCPVLNVRLAALIYHRHQILVTATGNKKSNPLTSPTAKFQNGVCIPG